LFGTLIDWETGIRTAFNQSLKGAELSSFQESRVFGLYEEEEKRIEFEEAIRPYREILSPASSSCTLQARDIQLQTSGLYHSHYKQDGRGVRIGAMESLVISPTAEPRGSSDIGNEFFFLKLFLRSTIDSASRAGAAPIETELFGVETQVERLGFYSGPAVPPDL